MLKTGDYGGQVFHINAKLFVPVLNHFSYVYLFHFILMNGTTIEKHFPPKMDEYSSKLHDW